eukprot:CAMPEP_0176290542 /NCGR_PEP_ID=MMETSP0121_2-20121125/55079_1 /TAXON_ID=160619 /ORGANISM="Kryptoperidinium foliaceum, Strain CCMP 1326" /LENGTH=69 /DNA_ID=CAMNT_0017631341 /DNA_START=34 /DNA_END=240 /DNA_ORIENTATION=-
MYAVARALAGAPGVESDRRWRALVAGSRIPAPTSRQRSRAQRNRLAERTAVEPLFGALLDVDRRLGGRL